MTPEPFIDMGFVDKVNPPRSASAQDRRCALLAASQLMSNSNLLKMGATPATNAKKVTDAAEVLLEWLQ